MRIIYGYIKNILFQKLFGNYSNSFLIIAILFGLLQLIIVPPTQIPDEANHFLKVYSLAEFNFNPIVKDNQLGDYLPHDLNYFLRKTAVTPTNEFIAHDPTSKFDTEIYSKFINQPFNVNDTGFLGFTNTATKTILVYLPAVIAVFIGGLFNFPPLFLFLFARTSLFIIFLVVGYQIIKTTPITYKSIAFVTLLMPMTLFLSIGITADTITILASTSFIMYILKLRQFSAKTNYKQLFIVLGFAIVLGLIKSTYATLALLIFLLPPFVIANRLKDFILKSFLVSIPVFIVLYGLIFGAKVSVPLRLDVLVDPAGQLSFLISHPFKFFELIFLDLIHNAAINYRDMIGNFGWLDTKLPVFAYICTTLILILTCINSSVKTKFKQLNLIEFGIIIFILGFSYLFTMLFLYLLWTPVGYGIILGYQGRYLLPFLPLFLILLQSVFDKFRVKINTYYAIIFLTILVHIFTIKALVYRYYIG